MSAGPLTLGTAGHVDHGKTALIRALTGVDTDRLPEERARGLSIVLGYAPLALPSGRRMSVVDVPGHERFVRTMVAGATGIDAFLAVIAADDGAMPQTVEHAAVLHALGIHHGVVAITKADLADPSPAEADAGSLFPGCPVVPCSARAGSGLQELTAALDLLAEDLEPARDRGTGVRLHVDRSFTIAGRGTVLTGTLWSGQIATGQALELALLRGGHRRVRVRAVQIHDAPVEAAEAGQRVAVNLVGVRASEAGRGDVLLEPGLGRETCILDCELELHGAHHGERVHVHHGTRDVPGRACLLADRLWQLRLERPLLALAGDRLVVRRLAPPDTLGGGRILDPAARRHGAQPQVLARLRSLVNGGPPPAASGATVAPVAQSGGNSVRSHDHADPGGNVPTDVRKPPSTKAGAPRPGTPPPQRPAVDPEQSAALERRLLEAGPAMLSEAQMAGEKAALEALREDGKAVRISGRLYCHADVAARIRQEITDLLESEGSVSLAGVRDALGLSRKSSQAFLEHLDSMHLTRRMADDTRMLIRRRARAAR